MVDDNDGGAGVFGVLGDAPGSDEDGVVSGVHNYAVNVDDGPGVVGGKPVVDVDAPVCLACS